MMTLIFTVKSQDQPINNTSQTVSCPSNVRDENSTVNLSWFIQRVKPRVFVPNISTMSKQDTSHAFPNFVLVYWRSRSFSHAIPVHHL